MKRALADDFFSTSRIAARALDKQRSIQRIINMEIQDFEADYLQKKMNAQYTVDTSADYPNGMYFAVPAHLIQSLQAKQYLLDNYRLYYVDAVGNINRMYYAAHWTTQGHALNGYAPPADACFHEPNAALGYGPPRQCPMTNRLRPL